jgi:putative ABC transport system substrate-binding protein
MVFSSSLSASAHLVDAFRQGLRELDWVEGKNIEIELRAADGNLERLPAIAAELVSHRVDLIVAPTTQATRAARNATSTIPIVMVVPSDPVGAGLVDSLARPGGNITGMSLMALEIGAKQLQILKEAVPRASRDSVLRLLAGPSPILKEMERAAPVLGLQFQVLTAASPEEFDDAFPTMIRGRSNALLVEANPVYFLHRKRLADLAVKARLPAMFGVREYVEAAGLMAYGPSYTANHRRAAVYVDKILKGAKPANLPVEQPTKFELVINLKTAKALGLMIPPSLLGRADEVIQ